MKRLALLLGLAACGQQDISPEGEIIVATGGSLVTIRRDDLVTEAPTVAGMARPASARRVHGGFERARTVIAAEGPVARLTARPGAEVCMDYAPDKVMITPPLPEFDFLVADCPDLAVLSLARSVLVAVAP